MYPIFVWELLAVWHGGLSMHGALLVGTVAGAWWIRRGRLPFWRFADVVAPVASLIVLRRGAWRVARPATG